MVKEYYWAILAMIVMIIVIYFGVSGAVEEINNDVKRLEYCKSNGYDGFDPSERGCVRCYKKVSSETEVGFEYKYSGCIG